MEKHIYIVLSHTNTKMGKMIRLLSNYTYNHVSISAESTLQPLYSFARYHYNASLVGGFIEESPLRYILNENNTKIRVYDITVTEEQFQTFQTIIAAYKKERNNYIYDSFYLFRKEATRSPYRHTCLSFIVSILQELNLLSADTSIKTIKELADALSPFSYTNTEFLAELKSNYTWGNDKYYEMVDFQKNIKITCQHFRTLLS